MYNGIPVRMIKFTDHETIQKIFWVWDDGTANERSFGCGFSHHVDDFTKRYFELVAEGYKEA